MKKLSISFLVLMIMLLILSLTAFAETEYLENETHWDKGEMNWRTRCITTYVGELLPEYGDDVSYGFGTMNVTDTDQPSGFTHHEDISRDWTFQGAGEVQVVMLKKELNASGGISYSPGKEVGDSIAPVPTLHPHQILEIRKMTIYIKKKFVTVKYPEIQKTRFGPWEPDGEPSTYENYAVREYTLYYGKPLDADCFPNESKTLEDKKDGHYFHPCGFAVCKKGTNYAVFPDHLANDQFCIFKYADGAKCTDVSRCVCGKKGKVLGHDPDYNKPIVMSEDEVRYPCARPGCDEIAEFHFHTFKNTGVRTPKDNYLIIDNDNENHRRLYMEERQCEGEHCKILREYPKYDVEPHGSWHNEVVIPATCTKDGSRTRMCALCDYVDVTVLEASGHAWVNNGNEEKTNEVRKLSSSNVKYEISHERKYVQKQKCTNSNCPTKTRTVVTWKSEKHSWPDWEITKKANCVKEGSKRRSCNVCEMKVTKVIEIDPNNHNWSDPTCTKKATCKNGCGATKGRPKGHNYQLNRVISTPTCTKTGLKEYKCSRCQSLITEETPKAHVYSGNPSKCKFCGKPKNMDTQ